MSYYLNVKTKKLHEKDCPFVKKYLKDNKENWIKFGSSKEAKKHCKNDNGEYKYCGKCFGKDGGKIVK